MASKLKIFLYRTWFPVFVGAGIYVGRLLYEETILTWRNGPQNVMFSFFHLHPFLYMVSLLCVFLLHAWLVIWVVVLIIDRCRDVRPRVADYVLTGVTVGFVLLCHLPIDKIIR